MKEEEEEEEEEEIMSGNNQLVIPKTHDAKGEKLNCEERFVGERAMRTAEGAASLLGMTKDILMERKRRQKEEVLVVASPEGKTTNADDATTTGEEIKEEEGGEGEEGGEEKKDDESRLDWKPPHGRKRIKLGDDQTLEMPYKYDFLKYDLNLPGLRELALPEIMRNNAGHIDYRTISHQRVLTLFHLLHNSELAEIPCGEELAKKREVDREFALANNVKRRKRKIEPEEPDIKKRLAAGRRGWRRKRRRRKRKRPDVRERSAG